MRILLAVLLFAVVAATVASAQVDPDAVGRVRAAARVTIPAELLEFWEASGVVSPEGAQEAAAEGLGALMMLVSEENFRTMGFDSLEEAKTAELGVPMLSFMVRLDELQEYEPGTAPDRLLHSVGQVVYPVTAGGRPRSSVVVARMDDRWVTTNLGAPNLIRLLTRTRRNVVRSSGLPRHQLFTVQVPALNLHFLGHRANGSLMLTPVLDDPAYGFSAGQTISAERAFEAILPAARAHDGLPG